MSARPVTLCADDYGYRPGVSAAIRRLVAEGRLSATSALVGFPDWPSAAPHVAEMRARADVGLHINLVEGAPLGPMPRLAPDGRLPSIGDLVRLAFTGAIDRIEVRDEVRRQIDAFTAATGIAPDFVDGHQHAHALPEIGAAVLAAVKEAIGPVPVRVPSDRMTTIWSRGLAVPKAAVIAALTRGFGRRARAAGMPTNEGFSGVYAFAPHVDLSAAFRAFFSRPGARHLVMCHPGDPDDTQGDPIAAARTREAAYLASDRFAADLAATATRLVRFTELVVDA